MHINKLKTFCPTNSQARHTFLWNQLLHLDLTLLHLCFIESLDISVIYVVVLDLQAEDVQELSVTLK